MSVRRTNGGAIREKIRRVICVLTAAMLIESGVPIFRLDEAVGAGTCVRSYGLSREWEKRKLTGRELRKHHGLPSLEGVRACSEMHARYRAPDGVKNRSRGPHRVKTDRNGRPGGLTSHVYDVRGRPSSVVRSQNGGNADDRLQLQRPGSSHGTSPPIPGGSS